MMAWWYYAVLALTIAAVLVAFLFIRWASRVNGKRELRQIRLQHDRDMSVLDYHAWKAVRDLEEWAASLEQAVREHPERVAALSEDVTLRDACQAVAS